MKKERIANLVITGLLLGTYFKLLKRFNEKQDKNIKRLDEIKDRNYVLLYELNNIKKQNETLEEKIEETNKELKKVKESA